MDLPIILDGVLLTSALFYSIVGLALTWGVLRIPRCQSEQRPPVSVIVAARNEEKNIGSLLDALTAQDYPDYEVIIVNDRSTDGTAAIVESYLGNVHNLRIITIDALSGILPPKKNALETGIRAAKGEILCFTDADCIPQAGWISSLVDCFSPDVGLVAGFSPYADYSADTDDGKNEKDRWYSGILLRFVQYEELRGALWAAGSIALGKPWLCTGRNLAYRKTVWEEVGGFNSIRQSISGDDDLFLQHVRKTSNWRIRFSMDPQSFVRTYPPDRFGTFVEQRKRHFSAGKWFSPSLKLFFLTYHAANLALVLSLAFIAIPDVSSSMIPYSFLAKLLADGILLMSASGRFRLRSLAIQFPLMEILYTLYNTVIGPLGFLRSFAWKS